MKAVKAYFKWLGKVVLGLVALFLFAVAVCLTVIIWSDAEYLLAVLATVGLGMWLTGVFLWRRKKQGGNDRKRGRSLDEWLCHSRDDIRGGGKEEC